MSVFSDSINRITRCDEQSIRHTTDPARIREMILSGQAELERETTGDKAEFRNGFGSVAKHFARNSCEKSSRAFRPIRDIGFYAVRIIHSAPSQVRFRYREPRRPDKDVTG